MVNLEFSALIDRPVHDVFTYLTTLTNLPQWQSMAKEVKPVSTGGFGVGSTFSVTGEMLGRPIEGQLEVTEYEPDAKFGYKGVNGPMTVNVSIAFKSVGTGTKLNLSAHAEPGGVFKMAEGVLANQVKGQMQTNLDKLKSLLEAGA
jgi:uncharacterized membrane protein